MGDADATLTLTSNNFQKMFAGQLKPTAAFMSGRLKISGNMGKAMKLEAIMGKISGVLNEELVKKTNSVFSFSLSDTKEEYFLDMKNGAGSCGPGKASTAPDATLTMSTENFNKMFSGQLKPAQAFMSGKLKISGNMGQAMKLEKLMGKLQTRGYHSLSGNRGKA